MLSFIVSEAFVDLRRAGRVGVSAILLITLSLTALGGFWLLSLNLGRAVGQWRDRVRVVVFLKEEPSNAALSDLTRRIEAFFNSANVRPGISLSISRLYDTIQSTAGVDTAEITKITGGFRAGRGISRGGGGGGSRGGKKGGLGQLVIVLLVLWVITWILAPIISQFLAMAVSRKREFLADAMGAQFTRNPMALATALQKIEGAESPTSSIKRGAAHLCIADPLGRRVNLHEGGFSNLLATHPPMTARIARLKGMAYQRLKAEGQFPTA